jgi:hypothetical protein
MAALWLFQQSRTQATLTALKSRVSLNAPVRRDRKWKTIQAVELVPGDVLKLLLGAGLQPSLTLSERVSSMPESAVWTAKGSLLSAMRIRQFIALPGLLAYRVMTTRRG